MAFTLPLKTTETDLDKVSGYLANQVGWVSLSKIGTAIASKHVDNRKIEAMRYLGLIERDGENVKLTNPGREYASGDSAKKSAVMQGLLRAKPLYKSTLDWMFYQDKASPNKTDVANQWHDNHADETAGATNEALTQSAVFFMRMVGVADLGKFVAAGTGRETHLEMEPSKLEAFVKGAPPATATPEAEPESTAAAPVSPPVHLAAPSPAGLGLNINLEIHIAADAKPATVEEIFKNMRKYLIDGPDSSADGG